MPHEPKIFPPKKVSTRVKHFILERYLAAWGGIIVNSNPRQIRLPFVDTCCGSGLYQADPDGPIEEGTPAYELGSALLGPTRLADLVDYARSKGRDVSAKALLINKNAAELATVESALPAEVRKNVEVTVRLRTFEEAQGEVAEFCRNRFSFVFIDPYGPSPTPFDVVSQIVRGKFTDTLINFPFLTLQKWSGFLQKPSRTREEELRLAAADAFMGGPAWRKFALEARRDGHRFEDVLVPIYVSSLRNEGVFAIALPLLFEDKERIIYHLVFTTHNVAGLAAAKRSFADAQDQQVRLRNESRVRKTHQPAFAFMAAPQAPAADVTALAHLLEENFRSMSATFEEVIARGLSEEAILESDVRKALTFLKRKRKIEYAGTHYSDTITFLGTKSG